MEQRREMETTKKRSTFAANEEVHALLLQYMHCSCLKDSLFLLVLVQCNKTRAMPYWLRCWISNPGDLGSKPLGGLKELLETEW